MATAIAKKSKTPKRKKTKFPLPDSADTAVIAGREYIIVPSDDLEEWYIDQMLGMVATERLKTDRATAAPLDEVIARLQKKKVAKRKTK